MDFDGLRPRGAVIENIENYIVRMGLKPGDRLPSERAMCEMWHVNRMTLRSGIAQLSEEGVVMQKGGSGTYVAIPKLVRNLQDNRGFHYAAVAAGRKVESRVLTFERAEADKKLGRLMKKALGHKLWHLVRLRLMDGIPVSLSGIYLDAALFPGLDEKEIGNDSLYEIIRKEYGVEPYSGEETLSIAYCTPEEASLLETSENAAVILQSGTTLDEDKMIFEFFKEITLPKYISFSSRLIRR